MQLLTEVLCSEFKCGLGELQAFFDTRKGRHAATLMIAKYKLYRPAPGSSIYEFKGFDVYQKLTSVAVNEGSQSSYKRSMFKIIAYQQFVLAILRPGYQ